MPCGKIQEYQFELKLTNTNPNDPRAPLRTDKTDDVDTARKKLEAFAHISLYERLRAGWIIPGQTKPLAACPADCPHHFFLFGLSNSYFKLALSADQPEHGCDWDYHYRARVHIAVYCLKKGVTLKPAELPADPAGGGCGPRQWEQSMESVHTGPGATLRDLDNLSFKAEQEAINEMFWAAAQVVCPPNCPKKVAVWHIETSDTRRFEDPETGLGMAEVKVRWHIRLDCVSQDTPYSIGPSGN